MVPESPFCSNCAWPRGARGSWSTCPMHLPEPAVAYTPSAQTPAGDAGALARADIQWQVHGNTVGRGRVICSPPSCGGMAGSLGGRGVILQVSRTPRPREEGCAPTAGCVVRCWLRGGRGLGTVRRPPAGVLPHPRWALGSRTALQQGRRLRIWVLRPVEGGGSGLRGGGRGAGVWMRGPCPQAGGRTPSRGCSAGAPEAGAGSLGGAEWARRP